MPPIEIRALTAADWPAVERIYAEGIATGHATFEAATPGWDVWDRGHRPYARFVAEEPGGRVVGWAALAPASSRLAYAGVAEVSVYVAADRRRQGVGTALLHALVAASEAAGVWTLQATVMAENAASIALHERAGFRSVGRRERIGRVDGIWRDTVLLERRSAVVD